jgi:hypothetical protein
MISSKKYKCNCGTWVIGGSSCPDCGQQKTRSRKVANDTKELVIKKTYTYEEIDKQREIVKNLEMKFTKMFTEATQESDDYLRNKKLELSDAVGYRMGIEQNKLKEIGW